MCTARHFLSPRQWGPKTGLCRGTGLLPSPHLPLPIDLQYGMRHRPIFTLGTPPGRRQMDWRQDRWTRGQSVEDGACLLLSAQG